VEILHFTLEIIYVFVADLSLKEAEEMNQEILAKIDSIVQHLQEIRGHL